MIAKQQWIDTVMEQAQAFANAQAMLGSRFAREDEHLYVEQERQILADMLATMPNFDAPAIPAGFALVPLEPTPEMLDACRDLIFPFDLIYHFQERQWSIGQTFGDDEREIIYATNIEDDARREFARMRNAARWQAMLQAAPKAGAGASAVQMTAAEYVAALPGELA